MNENTLFAIIDNPIRGGSGNRKGRPITTDKNVAIKALARFIVQSLDRDVLEKTWETC